MRVFVYALSLLLLIAPGVGGQRKPVTRGTPPPAGIFDPVTPGELRSFTAPDGAFRAIFAGNPEPYFEELEFADVWRYQSKRGPATEEVLVAQWEFDLQSLEGAYASTRKYYEPGPETSESEIVVSGRKGREFIGLNKDGTFERLWLIALGNRLYSVGCRTANWSVQRRSYPERIKAFRTECDRFFGGFEILKFPPSEAQPTPDEFLGFAGEGVYDNPYFGFRLRTPAEWNVLDDSEIRSAIRSGAELYGSESESFRKTLEESIRNDILIFGVAKGADPLRRGSNLLISVRKQPVGKITASAVLEASLTQFKAARRFTVGKPKKLNLGGVRVAYADIANLVGTITIQQRLYIFMRRGFSVVIMITHVSDSDLTLLEKSVESLEFK